MRNKKFLAVLALACATSLSLTACGGSTGSTNKAEAGDVAKSLDADSKLDIKATAYEDVADGGTITFAVGSMGPQFNRLHLDGNAADVSSVLRPQNPSQCWNVVNLAGDYELNKDFCEDVKEEIVDGKQILTYKLNEKATWNDGTPIDYKTFENQWKIMNGSNKDYKIVDDAGYKDIESVERGANDKEVIVTLKTPYALKEDLFAPMLHPAVNTPDIFNNQFIDKMHPEWQAGPFTIEKHDVALKQLVLKRNPNWWGRQAKLEQIVFLQMESSAANSAYKNGQINVTGANNINRYNQVKDTPNNEFRWGNRAGAFGYRFNTKGESVQDINIRKAIYQGIDRTALRKIWNNGMNWEEENIGSFMFVPMSKYYQDNYPVKPDDPEGAKKTLEDAGYTMGSDGYFAKDGKVLTVRMTVFGDDAISKSMDMALQKQMKDIGIKLELDERPSADFSKVLAARDYELLGGVGYTVGADGTSLPGQIYRSDAPDNSTACGSAAVDAEIDKIMTVLDMTERAALANKVEKQWQEECFAFLPSATYGPTVHAINKYIVNYGPMMYITLDWTQVGWEKDHVDGK